MPEIEVDVKEFNVLFNGIRNSLNSTSSSSPSEIRWRIIQSHHYDRPQQNTSPYTPKIISIGPLHHGKPELQPMENFKHKYLNDLLNRRNRYEMIPSPSRDGRNDELLRRFIKAASEMEERARSGYVLPPNTISSDDFVKMLVIDGCFLLELFIKRSSRTIFDGYFGQLPSLIRHEILLLENQIPFYVLEEFYKIHKILIGEPNTTTMMEIACDYVNYESTTFFSYYDKLEIFFEKVGNDIICDDPDNLLHFYHNMTLLKHHQQTSINLIRKWTMTIFSWLFVIISYPMFLIHQLLFTKPLYRTRPTTATELEEAGVKFQGSAMGLRFEKGIFFIPALTLDDQNLCILKNLLAFEFYYPHLGDPVVHRYVAMLFHLIKNSEDLKVLEKHHIIITSSSAEESSRLINDLIQSGFRNYEYLEYENLWYLVKIKADLMDSLWRNLDGLPRDALMAYCEKPHHQWRAKLEKDYLGNPWSILGLFVGVLLLVLATLQTVFTVLSYYK